MVGREGVLAAPFAPGHDSAPFEFVWQTSGEAIAIGRDSLVVRHRALAARRRSHRPLPPGAGLPGRLDGPGQCSLDLLGRLSRAILMAADRLGPQVPFTHTGMASLLQVRRAGVTEALHKLEGEGAIQSTRCLVTIRNAALLRERAGDTYGPGEREIGAVVPGWSGVAH